MEDATREEHRLLYLFDIKIVTEVVHGLVQVQDLVLVVLAARYTEAGQRGGER